MPQAMGGMEIYTHTLALYQKNEGHEVGVINPHIDYYRPGQIKEHYTFEGIDVYQFPETGNPTDRELLYGNKKPSGIRNFVSIITKLNPDIIHFHELNRSLGFTLEHIRALKPLGKKIFLTMHLPFFSCNTNVLVYGHKLCDGIIHTYRCSECSYQTLFNVPAFFSKPLAKLSLGAAQATITANLPSGKVKTLLSVPSTIKRIKSELQELSEHVTQLISLNNWYKDILIKNGVPEHKITIVPQGFTCFRKKETQDIKLTAALPIKIVFVGRIQPLKGIHLLIHAIKPFSSQQVQVDIYGKIENEEYYQQCLDDSSELNSICWKGEIGREEVITQLGNYHILCLPSITSEMSPLVIQEAFAAGLPVLASKVYGNMDQVKDGYNGLLFDFNSTQSLYKKIRILVENPMIINEMKNNVRPPLDFATVHTSYLKLYQSS